MVSFSKKSIQARIRIGPATKFLKGESSTSLHTYVARQLRLAIAPPHICDVPAMTLFFAPTLPRKKGNSLSQMIYTHGTY